MRFFKGIYLLWGVIIFLLVTGSCSLAGTGTTTGGFLVKISGSRPAGMGNAFSAMEDDVNAALQNPASIGTLTQSEVSFLYSDLGPVFNVEGAGNMYHGLLLYGAPWGEKSGVALGVQYEEQGKISYTTDSPNVITTYSLGANYSILLTYARKIGSHLILGISPKLIHTQLWEYEDTGWAGDAGILYQSRRINIGVSVNNFGEKLTMEDAPQADPLPQNLKLGFLYKIPVGAAKTTSMSIALDMTKPAASDNLEYNAGIEYWYHGILALRGGYLKEAGEVEGFTQGLGLRFGNLQVDIASIPWGELGDAQRISFTVTF